MAVLAMNQISKNYSGNWVLKSVDFSLQRGETRALLGENGAGKSTLIKILSGAVMKDQGEILIEDQPVDIRNPQDSMRQGVSVIYQEFTLVPKLSIAENIFLGRIPMNGPRILWKEMKERSRLILERLGCSLNVDTLVGTLGIADQQLVEIAKALSTDSKIIVMDEPTATLSKSETAKLFDIIRRLKQQGVAIIYVSHRMEEIFEIADSVTILRDGEKVGDFGIGEVSPSLLVRQMVGRELANQTYQTEKTLGSEKIRLSRAGIKNYLNHVDLTVRAGEIVGVTGLIGAGQTQLVQGLFGMRKFDRGTLEIDGVPVVMNSPEHAIRKGIGLIPEDRRKLGLVLMMSVLGNITLSSLKAMVTGWFLNRKAETETADDMIEKLKIKTTGRMLAVGKLSGGNQQKVVIAKWLTKNSDILIFHEPTRGIDVGAKDEIYRLIVSLAQNGSAILVVSSDIHEVLSLCDRLYVLRQGEVVLEKAPSETSKEEVLLYAAANVDNNGKGTIDHEHQTLEANL